tara:strand:- start:795 stop:1607 length:813 start_codon:yes stop_codon:yes gene_type:complete
MTEHTASSSSIIQWIQNAPWSSIAQVEQDLYINRALIEIFSHSTLKEKLAFRGGTALHKIFISPPARYSEDIDLVQVDAGPIGPIFDALKSKLDPWLGKPKFKEKNARAVLLYRFQTSIEPIQKMSLKVEINTREHFSVLGFQKKELKMQNSFFSGKAQIKTYALEELLATKLRALYQRKKGRDLFDFYSAFKHHSQIDTDKIIHCYKHYMKEDGAIVSKREFENNLNQKLKDKSFLKDMIPLLQEGAHLVYDPIKTADLVIRKLIEKLD